MMFKSTETGSNKTIEWQMVKNEEDNIRSSRTIVDLWSIDDIVDIDNDLDESQCIRILQDALNHYDANVGLSISTFEFHIEQRYGAPGSDKRKQFEEYKEAEKILAVPMEIPKGSYKGTTPKESTVASIVKEGIKKSGAGIKISGASIKI